MSGIEKLNEDEKIDETTSDEANTNDMVKDIDELTVTATNKQENEFDNSPSGDKKTNEFEKAPEQDKKTNDAGESAVVKTPTQRKLRLNRRGFHLANSPTNNLETKDAAQKPSDINGNNDLATKTEVPKKVISLRSVKRNLPEQTLEPAKRKFEKIIYGSVKKEESASAKTKSSETSENSSNDLPAKKHKPITWP